MEQEISLSGRKIVMIIAAKEFRDEEYFEPKNIFEKAGAEVITASSSLDEAVGKLGGKTSVDILLEDINVQDTDAVLFIGGNGSREYWDNTTAHTIAREAAARDIVIGAICIAPVTLAKAGILKGRKATAFPDVQPMIKKEGAICKGNSVEIDGNIVTADGPKSATAFGNAIKKLLLISQ